MKSKQSQIEALTMRVKHDRDALLSTLNSLRERNELLVEQVERLEIDLRARARDSTRRTDATTTKILAAGPSRTSSTLRANYEYGCELREAPWSADAEKHKEAKEKRARPRRPRPARRPWIMARASSSSRTRRRTRRARPSRPPLYDGRSWS